MKRAQSDLVRIRRNESGQLTTTNGTGRSAYVCPDTECLSKIAEGDRLSRALKRPIDPTARLSLAQELQCHQR